ncbi:MAG: hypothetical protein NTX59_07815 [Elusimicrobia bacterium]|nr:hypothetical protein [Elusimicrobiota bacterium]
MESIVFFGKGGIGKSTIASNMSVILAFGGRKVLHVGCDPKMDCCLSLMRRHIPPFADRSGGGNESALRKSIYPSAVKGVYCIEAGGPQPGVGCAGTGIGSMLDAMKDGALMEKDGYDAAVFDVLGDVVCGGFAAPLRRGFAKKAVIVTSEEILSLYAANKLIMMINNYARNGVYLAGLAVNAKSPDGVRMAEDFAGIVNTRVLGVILRDPAVAAAEREHRPAALAFPKSDFALRAVRLCSALRTAGAPDTPPRAMPDAEFFVFAEGRREQNKLQVSSHKSQVTGRGSQTKAHRSAVSLFEAAGFKPSGMEGGQIICDWKSSKGVFKTVIAPASAAQEGMPRFSDWAVCFHPSAGKDPGASNAELLDAAAQLSSLRFDDMLSTFTGMKDFYGALIAFGGPEDKTLAAPDTPKRPHIGFGQWQRFIFPGGGVNARIPPGSVMVEHGDSECRFSGCAGGALGIFSENAGLKCSGRQFRGPLLPKSDAFVVNTEFQAHDAVFGDEAKMLESLYRAADQAGPGGLVEFYVGCSPILLSSDVRAFARRVEREKNVKVQLENYNSFGEHGPAKAAVRVEFMASRLSRGKAGKTRDVNLIDFGESAGRMSALLAGLEISAGEPGPDFYGAARASRLQVLSEPDTVLGPAFDKAGMKWILPPAPYGFAGTDAWLAAVAGALGWKKITPGPSAAQKAAALELWRRARGYAVCFVLAAEETGLLSGSPALRMVPVLPVLAEAGFEVRLFITGGGSYGKTGADISALKASLPGRRLSAEFFKTPRELAALLRSGPALRLVYSDIRSDPRVVSAGKTPFSAALFEPGYDGALETRRRLLELCEWNFNERYLSSK